LSTKDTLFYRGNTSISVDFSASDISTDGSLILLEQIERKHNLIKKFGKYLPDLRNPRLITYSREAQLKQRVFMLMLGYEDVNDVTHLQHDPLFKDVLQGDLASQPTISRFENSMDKHSIFEFAKVWVDHYVSSLSGRKRIVIDVDATDDPTHGNQQMSMFNGYYGQFMLNELFFHDGQTGQIILPVLRPGNSHSNKWYVGILKRIIIKIREAYPKMEISLMAHTDSRGTERYNQWLSRKRVKAAINYLVGKGINPRRLAGFGYGESKLTNHCKDDVPCTELEHQQNRRTEFSILKMGNSDIQIDFKN